MWYEHKRGIFNLSLVRRVYIDDRAFNELVLVYDLGDTRNLAYDTEQEMYEAYQEIKSIVFQDTVERQEVTIRHIDLEDTDGNI